MKLRKHGLGLVRFEEMRLNPPRMQIRKCQKSNTTKIELTITLIMALRDRYITRCAASECSHQISLCLHKAIENASAGLCGPAGYEPSCCGVAGRTSTCRNEEWGMDVGRLTVSRLIESVGREKSTRARTVPREVQQLPKRDFNFNFQAHLSHFASCYTQAICDLKPDTSSFDGPNSPKQLNFHHGLIYNLSN